VFGGLNDSSIRRIAQAMDDYLIPEMFPVSSSNISAVGYDAENMILYVDFLRKGNDFSERQYRYFNVPYMVYDEMVNAPSVGSYFYHNIRPYVNDYPYERLL
jgi:hypothetical protein